MSEKVQHIPLTELLKSPAISNQWRIVRDELGKLKSEHLYPHDYPALRREVDDLISSSDFRISGSMDPDRICTVYAAIDGVVTRLAEIKGEVESNLTILKGTYEALLDILVGWSTRPITGKAREGEAEEILIQDLAEYKACESFSFKIRNVMAMLEGKSERLSWMLTSYGQAIKTGLGGKLVIPEHESSRIDGFEA